VGVAEVCGRMISLESVLVVRAAIRWVWISTVTAREYRYCETRASKDISLGSRLRPILYTLGLGQQTPYDVLDCPSGPW
jgi:hypothetical protein